MLAQVRRAEGALRAAPGNATLRMLLWYQVRVVLPAHPCCHATMHSARTERVLHRPASLGGRLHSA